MMFLGDILYEKFVGSDLVETKIRYPVETYTRYLTTEAKILEKIDALPSLKTLYRQANSTPKVHSGLPRKWIIRIDQQNSRQSWIRYNDREITIGSKLFDNEKISFLVRNLVCTFYQKQRSELGKTARQRQITGEEYAQGLVRIDFDVSKKYCETMKPILEEMGWKKSLDSYDGRDTPPKGMDFKTYWNHFEKYSCRSDFYRNCYADMTKTKVKRPELKSKLKSSIYLLTHPSWKDIKAMTIAIGIIYGVSLLFQVPNPKTAAIAGIIGVIAKRVLLPFLSPLGDIAKHLIPPFTTLIGVFIPPIQQVSFGLTVGFLCNTRNY